MFDNFNDSDWQSFGYLSLLLIVMLMNLLSRRNQDFSVILKYLGIWSAIGFVFVVLYSYRFELNNFKNKILGELNPSSAQINDSGEIIVNISEDKHFYVNTKINNVTVRFMIDTGASDVAISAKDALRIGIDIDKLEFNKVYQTANGKSFGASIRIAEIDINGIKFNDLNASVSKTNMGTSLLGMSFLRKLKKYEFQEDKLILTVN